MKHKLLAVAVAVVGIGVGGLYAVDRWPQHAGITVLGKPTLVPSIIAAGKDDGAPVAVAPAAPPPVLPGTAPPLHAKGAEFARLTAEGATPAMLSAAFELVKDCQNEALALAGGVQTSPLSEHRCQLPPGEPKAVALKRMLEARVLRADFGAYQDVQRERTGVYADDPEGWKALVKEARAIGIKRGEPIVMLAEAATQLFRGETLQEMGLLDEAQAAYRLALRYQVAHELGMAKLNKQPPNLSPKVDAVSAKVASQSARETEIEQGRTLARNWGNQS